MKHTNKLGSYEVNKCMLKRVFKILNQGPHAYSSAHEKSVR